MNQTNFQLLLDDIIENIKVSQITPSLLLHACCAPCSSYVLEYLSRYFNITVLFYNPNIFPEEEYVKRELEIDKFVRKFNDDSVVATSHTINIIRGNYNRTEFHDAVKGFEDEKEGGLRCHRCYELRMREAAAMAAKLHCDYFTTTLTLSPLKNAQKINEIGKKLSEEFKVKYLFSDFKKREGYKRSIELSKQYKLYRQNYCGCEYSMK